MAGRFFLSGEMQGLLGGLSIADGFTLQHAHVAFARGGCTTEALPTTGVHLKSVSTSFLALPQRAHSWSVIAPSGTGGDSAIKVLDFYRQEPGASSKTPGSCRMSRETFTLPLDQPTLPLTRHTSGRRFALYCPRLLEYLGINEHILLSIHLPLGVSMPPVSPRWTHKHRGLLCSPFFRPTSDKSDDPGSRPLRRGRVPCPGVTTLTVRTDGNLFPCSLVSLSSLPRPWPT